MKISAIVPIFNARSTIELTLRSLINQKIPEGVNFHIYIYNDGSADSVDDLISFYKKKYYNITYFINSVNRGVSYARNYLMDKADSDYYMLADSDDFSMPDRLLLSYEKIIEGYDIVGMAAQCFGDSSRILSYPKNQFDIEKICAIDQRIFCNPTLLINKRAANIKYKNIDAEDYLFAAESLISSLRITNIEEIGIFYRVSKNSLSSKKNENFKKLRESVIGIRAYYIKNKFNFEHPIALKISQSVERVIFNVKKEGDDFYLSLLNRSIHANKQSAM